MKSNTTLHTCPRCGVSYRGVPAISRADNKTEICPDCGTREALEAAFNLGKDEQDHIISLIHGGGKNEQNNS